MGGARGRGLRRDDESPARRCATRSTDDVPFSTLAAETEQRSRDGTVKTLFRTHDGHPVEAVLMRYRDGRRSVCVSSQSGCPLTCTFCATGRMAFGRNLTPWEILDQVLHFRRAEPVDHLVFMGMGEPFMNVESVLAAARRLPDIGHHAPADDDLHGGLGPRPDAVRRGRRRADPPRALAPRRRPARSGASSCRSTTATRSDEVRRALPRATGSGRTAGCSSST